MPDTKKPRTVKVRIAVSVDPTGDWCAFGYDGYDESTGHAEAADSLQIGEAHYWITAELPIPQPTEVAGKVEEGGDA